MSQTFQNYFYKALAFLTLVLITEDTDYYRKSFEGFEFNGFPSILNSLAIPASTYISLLILISVPLYLVTSIKPRPVLKLLSFISFWFVCAFLANLTHFNPPRAPWILASGMMIFISPHSDLNHPRNRHLTSLCQDIILLNYVLAGFWKIYNLIELNSWSDFLFAFKNSALDHIAYTAASGSGNPAHIQMTIKFSPVIPYIFTAFVLLQFFSFIPICYEKTKSAWSYSLIGFHLCSAIAMGLTFDYTIGALLLIVIAIDELKKMERIRSPGYYR